MRNAEPCTLYGSYASYYTAKVRAALRKKGVPFVEQLPSHGRFRNHIRPTSGSHRIPQLETADGLVVQDSTLILDAIETRYPDVPAFPDTPKQRLATHLMELFASEGLVLLAWRYRWFHPENLHFVKMDFGRSFRPQGSDEELLHYGQLIADRMLSRGNLTQPPELLKAMEEEFAGLLQRLEAHLIEWPYMLGGHPSAADYALMGALHAHMGRDPVPLHFMQRTAPRVFRWVEHMMTPEIHSPEFPDMPVAYAADDELPSTFAAVLRYLLDNHLERFARDAIGYNATVLNQRPNRGDPVSADEDQPRLPPIETEWRGSQQTVEPTVLNVWLLNRALLAYQGFTPAAQSQCRELMASLGAEDLLTIAIEQPPERQAGQFLFG